MATINLRKLANMLECPVCFGTLSNPRMMICGHILCHDCIKQLVQGTKKKKTVKCPTCRKLTKVEANVSDLPKPFIVKDVQETIHGLLKERTEQKQVENASCPSVDDIEAPAQQTFPSFNSVDAALRESEIRMKNMENQAAAAGIVPAPATHPSHAQATQPPPTAYPTTAVTPQPPASPSNSNGLSNEAKRALQAQEIRTWNYAKLRDAINTSSDVDFIQLVHAEFKKRLAAHRDWKVKQEEKRAELQSSHSPATGTTQVHQLQSASMPPTGQNQIPTLSPTSQTTFDKPIHSSSESLEEDEPVFGTIYSVVQPKSKRENAMHVQNQAITKEFQSKGVNLRKVSVEVKDRPNTINTVSNQTTDLESWISKPHDSKTDEWSSTKENTTRTTSKPLPKVPPPVPIKRSASQPGVYENIVLPIKEKTVRTSPPPQPEPERELTPPPLPPKSRKEEVEEIYQNAPPKLTPESKRKPATIPKAPNQTRQLNRSHEDKVIHHQASAESSNPTTSGHLRVSALPAHEPNAPQFSGSPSDQRYFKVPLTRNTDEGRKIRGWWMAHFDGQRVARQLQTHIVKKAKLGVAGVNDADLCEETLANSGLERRVGAEITEGAFENEWRKHGGADYTDSFADKVSSPYLRSVLKDGTPEEYSEYSLF